MNDTALAALQRTLSENREAKRKMLARLAEIEFESASLRSQLASLDAVIERTELALLQMLFPTDRSDRAKPAAPPSDYSLYEHPAAAANYDAPLFRLAETESALEAEVARLRQSEKTGNVRFTDFRIPQAATIVLREANRPLHVSEIYRRLAEGGFEFRGQHQLISLAVSLSRSKRFRKVAPGTFELDPNYQAGQVA